MSEPGLNKMAVGDTTYTKVFVGGLAWETKRDTLRRYFEQFGEILEAVVINDKTTGKSKGYGFVSSHISPSFLFPFNFAQGESIPLICTNLFRESCMVYRRNTSFDGD